MVFICDEFTIKLSELIYGGFKLIKITKKTIVFDFDGVIHKYSKGWRGISNIYDKPVEGIKELICKLRKKYKVVIVSARCREYEGRDAIEKYLNKYNITVDDIQLNKPVASIYIDDRAICFKGSASILEEQINQFKTWLEEIEV